MMYGIIFQECYESKKSKNSSLLAHMHRLMWLVMSMLLVMAFNGNLKTSLMINSYYDQTNKIAEIFDKDLTLHTDVSFCGLLKKIAHLSNIRSKLLNQARKSDSQMIITDGPTGMLNENERVLNEYGGVVVIRKLSYKDVRSTYMRKGHVYPFHLIPESYTTRQFMALFQKYDPRAEMFDPTISLMKDAGLIEYMHRKRLPYLGIKEHNNVAKEHKLEIKHFFLPLIFLGVGITLAMIAIVVEIQYVLKQSNK